MCNVKRCSICENETEICGIVCHGKQCQLYLPLYFRKHFKDGRYNKFDEEIWEKADPLWSIMTF